MNRETPQVATRSLRISELVEASGVSRDMIKYYLRANLLPPAEKPRHNLSLYTDNHLALIELIRKFQEQTRLSLQEIAAVFAAANYEAHAIELELISAKHGISGDDNIIPLAAQTPSSGGLKLPQDFLSQLADAELLEQSAQSTESDEQLAGLIWAAQEEGVPLSFFAAAQEKLAELADLEVKTLIGIQRPGLSFAETMDSVGGTNRVINRWMIAEKTRQIRSQFQRVIDNSERATATLLDTIYRPSHLFRARHNIESILSAVMTLPGADETSDENLQEASFACLLLGDYEASVTLANQLLKRSPDQPVATALIAIAHGVQNNVDEAYDFGIRLEDSHLYHPAIVQARLLSMLLKVAKLRGMADTGELMKNAAQLFLELPADAQEQQPEEALLLARANVAFPDFANSAPQAIAALERLLAQIENDSVALPDVGIDGLRDALRQVYRIYTQYYLGSLYSMAGEQQAAHNSFEQVVQIDPASNFGEIAYLQLGQQT